MAKQTDLLAAAVDAREQKDAALDRYRLAIKTAYLGGHSAYAIAKQLDVGPRAVLDVLDRLGVPRR